MYPPIVSDIIGVVVRDPNRDIFQEIKQALAEGKLVFIRGRGSLNPDYGQAEAKRARKTEIPS